MSMWFRSFVKIDLIFHFVQFTNNTIHLFVKTMSNDGGFRFLNHQLFFAKELVHVLSLSAQFLLHQNGIHKGGNRGHGYTLTRSYGLCDM